MDRIVSAETILRWKTDCVTEWLKTIGLEKYGNKFKRNMVTGAVLVQLDELLLDDLNISDINDREILLKSVAGFSTGNIEDAIKSSSLNQSPLITTSLTDEIEGEMDENQNERCEPEMEVLKHQENDNEEKETIFPAFAELLPTIGEEDEVNEGEHNIQLDETSIKATIFSTSLEIQNPWKLETNNKDGFEIKNENGFKEANRDESKEVASTSFGHFLTSEEKLEDDEVASRATQIVQVFSQENMCLRKQLEKYYQEIKHLKSVDKELRDNQIMYKDLKSAFITREHKEKAMRLRMEAEIAQLQNTNAQLQDDVKQLQALLANKPEEDVKGLKDEIKEREDEVKQLLKERKMSKSSLQNLERILKQKSSEIIILQQQLEKSTCKKCASKMIKEKEDYKPVDERAGTSGNFLEQFHESMIKSCGRNGTRFLNRSNHKFRSQNKNDELDIRTCVPVLVELLKEKDSEIAKLRKEIDEEMSRFSEMSGNKWLSNTVDERLPKHGYCRRYSDLETEIRSLHVQLAEKDAHIKILKCKYGESGISQSNATSAPFRIPSFTSQSTVSSYQDSGIMTTSDGHCDDITCQDARGDTRNSERYLRRLQELDNDNGVNREQSNKQGEEETILSDHCWFV